MRLGEDSGLQRAFKAPLDVLASSCVLSRRRALSSLLSRRASLARTVLAQPVWLGSRRVQAGVRAQARAWPEEGVEVTPKRCHAGSCPRAGRGPRRREGPELVEGGRRG